MAGIVLILKLLMALSGVLPNVHPNDSLLLQVTTRLNANGGGTLVTAQQSGGFTLGVSPLEIALGAVLIVVAGAALLFGAVRLGQRRGRTAPVMPMAQSAASAPHGAFPGMTAVIQCPCPQCGRPQPMHARYCNGCGRLLRAEPP